MGIQDRSWWSLSRWIGLHSGSLEADSLRLVAKRAIPPHRHRLRSRRARSLAQDRGCAAEFLKEKSQSPKQVVSGSETEGEPLTPSRIRTTPRGTSQASETRRTACRPDAQPERSSGDSARRSLPGKGFVSVPDCPYSANACCTYSLNRVVSPRVAPYCGCDSATLLHAPPVTPAGEPRAVRRHVHA